jgi:two-component system OmpR family response regulator
MRSLRLFLVEDSPVIRENLSATLEEILDAKVVGTAETESEAIKWLNGHSGDWDLAIVDIFLREGSGLGVLSFCGDRRTDTRIVVLSNYATRSMRERCLELHADRVFDKSNEIDALISYCETLSSQGLDMSSTSGAPL